MCENYTIKLDMQGQNRTITFAVKYHTAMHTEWQDKFYKAFTTNNCMAETEKRANIHTVTRINIFRGTYMHAKFHYKVYYIMFILLAVAHSTLGPCWAADQCRLSGFAR